MPTLTKICTAICTSTDMNWVGTWIHITVCMSSPASCGELEVAARMPTTAMPARSGMETRKEAA